MRLFVALTTTVILAFACESGNQGKKQTGGNGSSGKESEEEEQQLDWSQLDDAVRVPNVRFPGKTEGSGGQTGTFEKTYENAAGISGPYTLAVPEDIGADNSYGLLVYFHGDGAAPAYDASFETLKEIGFDQGMVVLAAAAPNNDSWWDGQANIQAAYIHELIQKQVFQKYNIDAGRVFFTGESGGSTFLTGHFIPQYAYKYRAGYVLFCGGEQNRGSMFSMNGDVLKYTRLIFHIKKGDFLREQAQRAIDYYEKYNLEIETHFPEGSSHCGSLSSHLGKYLKELDGKGS